MDNITLLELAGKANGFQVKGLVNDKLSYYDPITEWSGIGDWNPLVNDNDAFRLAVKLHFVIDIGPISTSVHENNGKHDIGFVWHDDDPYAATRLAIVTAAANWYRNNEN